MTPVVQSAIPIGTRWPFVCILLYCSALLEPETPDSAPRSRFASVRNPCTRTRILHLIGMEDKKQLS